MAWKEIRGLKGKLYVPETPACAPKKHPCADCFSCQLCSDERCSVCRGGDERCRNHNEQRITSDS